MWFLPAWFVVTVTDTDWSGLGLYLDTPFTAQDFKRVVGMGQEIQWWRPWWSSEAVLLWCSGPHFHRSRHLLESPAPHFLHKHCRKCPGGHTDCSIPSSQKSHWHLKSSWEEQMVGLEGKKTKTYYQTKNWKRAFWNLSELTFFSAAIRNKMSPFSKESQKAN